MGILQYMEYYAWTIPLTIRSYVNEGEVNQYLQQAPKNMLFQGSTTSRLLGNGRQERGIAVSTWLFDADSQVELLKSSWINLVKTMGRKLWRTLRTEMSS